MGGVRSNLKSNSYNNGMCIKWNIDEPAFYGNIRLEAVVQIPAKMEEYFFNDFLSADFWLKL